MGGVPMKFNRDGLPDNLPGWFYSILISFGVSFLAQGACQGHKYRTYLTRILSRFRQSERRSVQRRIFHREKTRDRTYSLF